MLRNWQQKHCLLRYVLRVLHQAWPEPWHSANGSMTMTQQWKHAQRNVQARLHTCSREVVSAADASSSRFSASCTMGSSFMQTACTLWGCSACSRLLPCVLVVAACNHNQHARGYRQPEINCMLSWCCCGVELGLYRIWFKMSTNRTSISTP